MTFSLDWGQVGARGDVDDGERAAPSRRMAKR
jgi:hypothetical protein